MNLSQQYDKIYRYCFFHTRCQELAEDLTQETFLRYYQHPQYQSTGKELQYLYVIARNLCIDTYRKPSAEPLSEENMPVVSVQDDDFITHTCSTAKCSFRIDSGRTGTDPAPLCQ